ncbi:ATPase domain-containing protein [Methylibium sp.]|uniref:ATPase domain-containing protein n=1 Tax=Methylibium sp. TaxID=2067992 RepID=UPI00286B9304|nr:ATPase domain-containing protein [Methylibium sp.]
MKHDPEASLPLDRLSSGIPGLDEVLGGGFFRSGVYIVLGMPGSGKTIFANQLCYGHVKDGGRAVYVTLLAESHARMLQHIRPLAFFDESHIPERLSYISAFRDLETDGLKGLMDLLRREMRARRVSVLVLDGLVAAAEAATTDRELKKFIHEIQTSAVFHGCTVFLLTSGNGQRVSAEHTMVDGLIELDDRLFEARAERSLQLRKFRGSGSLRGKHAFRISDAGIEVFPRLESVFLQPPTAQSEGVALSSGVPSLDALLAIGGFPEASASVVIGASGTGKTSLALHFLSRSSAAERGLLLSFFESPSRLLAKARGFGLGLEALESAGALRLMWRAQGEHVIDELGHQLLTEVREGGYKRVVIDGLSGFFEAATYPERVNRFFSCLVNELRRLGATVLMTIETRDAIGTSVALSYGVSGFVDNLLFLRFAEDNGRVRRLLTVTKMRSTDYSPGVHALEIGSAGMRIAGLFSSDGDVIPSAHRVDQAAAQAQPSTTDGPSKQE